MANLRAFLVRTLNISNKKVIELLAEKAVLVNGAPGSATQEIKDSDEILYRGSLIKEPRQFHYYAYYKPRGIESTMNPGIPDNLLTNLNLKQEVFPAGRLDKESEGLMILLDDGKLYDKIVHSNRLKEKEYIVTVDKDLTPDVITQLGTGVKIMGRMTRPALVEQSEKNVFRIILTEGMNRQIRRMCHKLGYEVQRLKRVRIVNVMLGDLKSGEIRELTKEEIARLRGEDDRSS